MIGVQILPGIAPGSVVGQRNGIIDFSVTNQRNGNGFGPLIFMAAVFPDLDDFIVRPDRFLAGLGIGYYIVIPGVAAQILLRQHDEKGGSGIHIAVLSNGAARNEVKTHRDIRKHCHAVGIRHGGAAGLQVRIQQDLPGQGMCHVLPCHVIFTPDIQAFRIGPIAVNDCQLSVLIYGGDQIGVKPQPGNGHVRIDRRDGQTVRVAQVNASRRGSADRQQKGRRQQRKQQCAEPFIDLHRRHLRVSSWAALAA